MRLIVASLSWYSSYQSSLSDPTVPTMVRFAPGVKTWRQPILCWWLRWVLVCIVAVEAKHRDYRWVSLVWWMNWSFSCWRYDFDKREEMQLCKGRVPRRRWELGFLVCCRSRSYCSWCCCWRELATSKHSCWHLAMTSVLLRRSTEKQKCAVSFIPLWLLMPRDWNWSMYSFVYLVDEHISEYVVQHEWICHLVACSIGWKIMCMSLSFVWRGRIHPTCECVVVLTTISLSSVMVFTWNSFVMQYMCPFCLGKLNLTCRSCSVCNEYTLPFVLWQSKGEIRLCCRVSYLYSFQL